VNVDVLAWNVALKQEGQAAADGAMALVEGEVAEVNLRGQADVGHVQVAVRHQLGGAVEEVLAGDEISLIGA